MTCAACTIALCCHAVNLPDALSKSNFRFKWQKKHIAQQVRKGYTLCRSECYLAVFYGKGLRKKAGVKDHEQSNCPQCRKPEPAKGSDHDERKNYRTEYDIVRSGSGCRGSSSAVLTGIRAVACGHGSRHLQRGLRELQH
jgi:hypothetical protein